MNQTPEQIKQSLFALTARGIKFDLDRIAAAVREAGNPQDCYRSLHVAGTNGKGSTCAFIESVLRGAGYTTGLFTSPHIVDFEERFRINGVPVEEAEWLEIYHDQRHLIDRYHLTFFEVAMLVAVELFRRRGVDRAVFETGLGGRLDATNILLPDITVITRIAMDHQEYLGNTLPDVAAEKLGIVKNGIPLVAVEPEDAEVKKLFLETCERKGAPCIFVVEKSVGGIHETESGTDFHFRNTEFSTRLQGRYQAVNAACAIEAILQTGPALQMSTVQKGIRETSLSCRFECREIEEKTVILDVAHNPDAVATLCETLRRRFPDAPVCIVAGIMSDKDFPAMIKAYLSVSEHLIFTRPATERAAAAEVLAREVPERRRTVRHDVATAVEEGLKRPEHIVCITGSFYTVGEAVRYLRGRA
jgi:dihydrofolate synthase/folylpolyglutamate synthase